MIYITSNIKQEHEPIKPADWFLFSHSNVRILVYVWARINDGASSVWQFWPVIADMDVCLSMALMPYEIK